MNHSGKTSYAQWFRNLRPTLDLLQFCAYVLACIDIVRATLNIMFLAKNDF